MVVPNINQDRKYCELLSSNIGLKYKLPTNQNLDLEIAKTHVRKSLKTNKSFNMYFFFFFFCNTVMRM